MNQADISMKETATNWGDNYASTVEIVDAVFSAPDAF